MKRFATFAASGILILSLFTFSGCSPEAIFKMFTVEGKVVNVRSASSANFYEGKGGASLVSAVVTLTNESDATKKYTGAVKADGKYSIADVPAGLYKMSGEKSGWSFVPRSIEISGFAATLPDMLAYLTPTGTDLSQILIISEWENKDVDIDLFCVIDDENTDATQPGSGGAVDRLWTVCFKDPAVPANESAKTTKKFPATDDAKVELERDVVKADLAAGKPAVETIIIHSNPFSDSTGWLRIYLNAFAATSGLTGDSTATTPVKDARPLIHVMQGVKHLGTFRLPYDTAEQTMCVVKAQVVEEDSNSAYYFMSPGNFGSNVGLGLEGVFSKR